MGVIPDRSDFVRRLTQGGVYTDAQASVLADALDATVGQPASRIDLLETRSELKQEIADLRLEVRVLAERVERLADRTLIRVSAVMLVLLTAFFGAAFRIATSVWPPPP